MRKIGILGGSFDPIHQGHLNIARSAYREFALDEVWFIPAGHSPNKEEAEMTPAQVRAEMTQAAIKNDASFKLSRIEIESSGTSYTYKTLQHLKEQFPEDQFFFIMEPIPWTTLTSGGIRRSSVRMPPCLQRSGIP